MNTINCRARLDSDCLNGVSTFEHFGEDLPMSADGTYQESDDTIICDACYLHLLPYTPNGRGLFEDLPAAIVAYNAAPEWEREILRP